MAPAAERRSSDAKSAPSIRKVTRSRHGCETCRARKVRCDERPGRCFNCERLGLICAPCGKGAAENGSSTQNSPQQPVTAAVAVNNAAGLKRKRTYRSCSDCRASKTRCSGHKPVCVRCRDKSLKCRYEDESEPAWKQRVAATVLPKDQATPQSESLRSDSGLTPESITSPVRRPEVTPAGSLGLGSPVVSVHNATTTPAGDDLYWLVAPHLPDRHRTRVLVERYFANVHHLRCFAFLHKPSFLQKLDNDGEKMQQGNALLHIVCALGALFYAVEYETSRNIALPINPLDSGKHWALHANNLILARLNRISVENLMAAVLLHDYEIRMGNYSNAFMLSAITARMAQALQINLEHSTDVLCREPGNGPSASVKESRRRLMWACYITDALVGSGIDQLTLIDEADIKIQLPCNERNFVLEEPCITETLEEGHMLKFLPPELLPTFPQDCMGMTAFYLRHISTRRKVLKYIKHLDSAKPPWFPDSEFAQLDAELRHWYDNLPANLQFTPTTLYIRQETSQVGALCALHYAYHQTMCDLYRIGTPSLYKLRASFTYGPEQQDFHRHLQNTLFGHARSLATIMAEALRHGPHAIADSWLPTILYDSCKIMLFYLTQIIDPKLESSKALLAETIPHVQNNVRALKIMRSMYAAAMPLSKAAETMVEKIGIELDSESRNPDFIQEDPYANNDAEEQEPPASAPGSPAQSAPDYILNPLSIYRLARKSIPEKHAPERQPAPTSAGVQSLASRPLSAGQHYSLVGADSHIDPGLRAGGVASDQINLEELQSLFSSDPTGWTWQPAETAVGSRTESGSLPPWESRALEVGLDAWLPTFALEP
ncbi:putative transcriptional regulatory protein [Cercospora beticola]|uniref:Putative transcriptional regulatory protein n=1 Tax=Cercospora beticola TaxID=122368 RepID=A0A2G5HH42_CERBT|nr:putative transcriptional regulatory protein [Cercospora beticola]PIA91860.1 putative transcriptional regulatory protein [Cercospora beticola]WPB06104.1 hypothetical protein RHO25_010761 [Cercospora beticola]CAK1365987.1 unnamed protein product [Cercospora beticola]